MRIFCSLIFLLRFLSLYCLVIRIHTDLETCVLAMVNHFPLDGRRFMYGPLDMVALTGEKVDVHFLRDATNGEWDLIATEVTDKTGRLVCTLPAERALPPGLHPIKMVVRGDHTYADLYLAVLPPKTQAVVFSIDGSFTASVSVTGRDPKVRAGAVDVVRHWQVM